MSKSIRSSLVLGLFVLMSGLVWLSRPEEGPEWSPEQPKVLQERQAIQASKTGREVSGNRREVPASEREVQLSDPGAPHAPGQKKTGPPPQDAVVYTVDEVPVKPHLLYRSDPLHTPEALEARVHGHVVVQGIIRKTGRVTNLQIKRDLGYGLGQRALEEVANHWRYEPAQKDGQPVEVQVAIEVDFTLPE